MYILRRLSSSCGLSSLFPRKKKETEQKVRSTKATLKDVNITETVENNVRNDQHGRDKNEKAIRTETKTNLRDVNMAMDTVESEVRKEQHSREKDWKATGRQQKVENTSFDMARALFNWSCWLLCPKREEIVRDI